MTEQEEIKKAIKMLKDWNKDLSLMEDEKEGIECHELAIKALEKQIKKEPVVHHVYVDGTKKPGCKVCNEELSYYQAYCYKCGQKIDWRRIGR